MEIDKSRMWVAFAVAPMLPALLVSVWFNLQELALFFLVASIVFCHLPALLFGLPLIFYLASRNKLYTSTLILPGACMGVLALCLFLSYVSDFYGGDGTPGRSAWSFVLAAGGGLGASTAMLFGVMAGFPMARMFDRPGKRAAGQAEKPLKRAP